MALILEDRQLIAVVTPARSGSYIVIARAPKVVRCIDALIKSS
jgi:hypothetical protein